MSSPVQISRFDKMMRKAFNVVGRGAIVTTLLEDVFPVMDLMNPAPEYRALGLEFIAFSQSTRAQAAEFNAVTLINPPDSGVIILVEEVIISLFDSTVGDLLHVGISQNNFGVANSNAQFRDARAQGVNRKSIPVGVVNSGSSVAGNLYPSPIKIEVTLVEEVRFDAPGHAIAILAPGDSLGMEHETLGTRVRANMLWRERAVDPAELTL